MYLTKVNDKIFSKPPSSIVAVALPYAPPHDSPMRSPTRSPTQFHLTCVDPASWYRKPVLIDMGKSRRSLHTKGAYSRLLCSKRRHSTLELRTISTSFVTVGSIQVGLPSCLVLRSRSNWPLETETAGTCSSARSDPTSYSLDMIASWRRSFLRALLLWSYGVFVWS